MVQLRAVCSACFVWDRHVISVPPPALRQRSMALGESLVPVTTLYIPTGGHCTESYWVFPLDLCNPMSSRAALRR